MNHNCVNFHSQAAQPANLATPTFHHTTSQTMQQERAQQASLTAFNNLKKLDEAIKTLNLNLHPERKSGCYETLMNFATSPLVKSQLFPSDEEVPSSDIFFNLLTSTKTDQRAYEEIKTLAQTLSTETSILDDEIGDYSFSFAEKNGGRLAPKESFPSEKELLNTLRQIKEFIDCNLGHNEKDCLAINRRKANNPNINSISFKHFLTNLNKLQNLDSTKLPIQIKRRLQNAQTLTNSLAQHANFFVEAAELCFRWDCVRFDIIIPSEAPPAPRIAEERSRPPREEPEEKESPIGTRTHYDACMGEKANHQAVPQRDLPEDREQLPNRVAQVNPTAETPISKALAKIRGFFGLSPSEPVKKTPQ